MLDGEVVKKVDNFCYLGSTFSANSISPGEDISIRIGKATAVFGRLRKPLWQRDDISIATKMRVYRSAVLPTLLYSSETWRVLETDYRRLEVFQMNCLRQIIGVSKLQRVSNEEIRFTCLNQPTVTNLVKRNRLRWYGHVARMEQSRIPFKCLNSQIPGNWAWWCPRAPKKLWKDLVKNDLEGTLKEAYGAGNWHDMWQQLTVELARDRKQ